MGIGSQMPTVMELRRQYSCSQATLERALDRLRREGLIERPAGQLRLRVAATADPAQYRIALIRPDYPSPTFEELSRVIIRAGQARDCAFDLQSYRKLSGLELHKTMRDVDGAILIPTSEVFPDHLCKALRRPHRPVVVIQDPPAGLRVSSVRIDDEQIGRLAVEHLAGLGHRRILLLMSEPHSPSGNARAAGWRSAMTKLGQDDLESLIIDPQLHPFDNSMLGTYDYFSNWLRGRHVDFTAVFCAAWTGAVAALRALRENDLPVPQRVSVIAHGGEGYMMPFLYPALTAVETDIQRYGRRVIEVMQAHLQNPGTIITDVVESKVVVRETTARRPAAVRPSGR